MRQVDLQSIILRALDEIDITQIVIDRVDVDEIVGKTDLDAVIDRIPMLQIADYIIEEIDLPQIIRESTGGVALDAFTPVFRLSGQTRSSRRWWTPSCCDGCVNVNANYGLRSQSRSDPQEETIEEPGR